MADLRMPDINKVIIGGNMTRDPELKYLPSGMACCELGVAVSRKYKNKSGELQEETAFVDVTLWNKTAEWVGDKLKKGMPVYIEGRLKMDTWVDNTTGQNRHKLKVTGDRVQQMAWDDAHAGGGNSNPKPQPRLIEEPIPDDDFPF